MLEKNGGTAAGGNIIVFTDGEENEKPFVSTVSPTVIQKVKVDNISVVQYPGYFKTGTI